MQNTLSNCSYKCSNLHTLGTLGTYSSGAWRHSHLKRAEKKPCNNKCSAIRWEYHITLHKVTLHHISICTCACIYECTWGFALAYSYSSTHFQHHCCCLFTSCSLLTVTRNQTLVQNQVRQDRGRDWLHHIVQRADTGRNVLVAPRLECPINPVGS